NLVGVDPRLGPLANNGGPTQTMALLPGSPALNAGSNALIPAGVTTDQRGSGFARVWAGGTVDIGAFEVQDDPPTITTNESAFTADEGSTVFNTATFHDPQGRGTVRLTASLGAVHPSDTTGNKWIWSYIPPDGPAGPTDVTITATDNQGWTATTTFTLTVQDVAPVMYVGFADSVDEGSPYTVTLGGVFAPGQDTVTQYIVHWGDGRSG